MENKVMPLVENESINAAENKSVAAEQSAPNAVVAEQAAQKPQKAAKTVKSSKSGKGAADFKRKYFDYYDDVKDHTKGREDW